MGFFSWKTQDTNQSIWNAFSSSRRTDTVHMIDEMGNVWTEYNYEGYGVFGGKDFYVLLAEMNGLHGTDEKLRDLGIDLAFSDKKHKSPNLVSDYVNWSYTNVAPKSCPDQGY